MIYLNMHKKPGPDLVVLKECKKKGQIDPALKMCPKKVVNPV